MRIVAIIPARKGSKGVKNKNIKIYKKKPLLYHSIKVALKLNKVDKVIVSTDSKKYKFLAEKFGAQVILRPKKISQDYSVDKEYLLHAYKFLKEKENYVADLFFLLRPTCPDRDIKILKKITNYAIKNFKKYTSIRTVHALNNPPQKLFQIKKNYLQGFFNNVLKGEYHAEPRQKYPLTYSPNSFLDVIKPRYFSNKKKLWGNKILPFVTIEYKDIDKKEDFN